MVVKFDPIAIPTILLSSSFGKMYDPSFEQTRIPFTQGSFEPSFIEIVPVVLEKMTIDPQALRVT